MRGSVVLSILVIGGLLGLARHELYSTCQSTTFGRAVSPDGSREALVLVEDCPGLFLLDFSHITLRLRLVRLPWIRQDVATFDVEELERIELPLVWAGDRHFVLTFGPGGTGASERFAALGVDVEVRRRRDAAERLGAGPLP